MITVDWDRQYQLDTLVIGGIPDELAEAVTNLLELHSMECYAGGDGVGGREWRIQHRRHAFKTMYYAVKGPRYELDNWIRTVRVVEAMFGREP